MKPGRFAQWAAGIAVASLVYGCSTMALGDRLVAPEEKVRENAIAEMKFTKERWIYRHLIPDLHVKLKSDDPDVRQRSREALDLIALRMEVPDPKPTREVLLAKPLQDWRMPTPPPQPVPKPPKDTPAGTSPSRLVVAVADLVAQGVSSSDAGVVSDWLRTELVKNKSLQLVEKKNIQALLAEQAFQQTGCTDSDCAVKVGKLLNAHRMIVGSFSKFMNSYYINVRIVDVESAEIREAVQASGKNEEEVARAVRKMATKLAQRIR